MTTETRCTQRSSHLVAYPPILKSRAEALRDHIWDFEGLYTALGLLVALFLLLTVVVPFVGAVGFCRGTPAPLPRPRVDLPAPWVPTSNAWWDPQARYDCTARSSEKRLAHMLTQGGLPAGIEIRRIGAADISGKVATAELFYLTETIIDLADVFGDPEQGQRLASPTLQVLPTADLQLVSADGPPYVALAYRLTNKGVERIVLQYLQTAAQPGSYYLYQLEIDQALFASQRETFQQWIRDLAAARSAP